MRCCLNAKSGCVCRNRLHSRLFRCPPVHAAPACDAMRTERALPFGGRRAVGGFRRFGLGLFRHGGRFFFGFRRLRLSRGGSGMAGASSSSSSSKLGITGGHRRGGRRGYRPGAGHPPGAQWAKRRWLPALQSAPDRSGVRVPGGMVRLILGLFRLRCFFCLRLFFCFSLRRCVFRRFFLRLHGCGLCRAAASS